MRSLGFKASMAIVCLVLGLMFATQFKANLHNPNFFAASKLHENSIQVANLRDQNEALVKQIIALRVKLVNMSTKDVDPTIEETLNKANRTSGFTPIKGAGLIITVDDNPDPLRVGDNPENYIVHDSTLLCIVNQLNVGGATAISVNGERLISSSEIRCAGPTILINLNRVSPPFAIRAIGNQEALTDALVNQMSATDRLSIGRIRMDIKEVQNLVVPAYGGIVQYRYARIKTT